MTIRGRAPAPDRAVARLLVDVASGRTPTVPDRAAFRDAAVQGLRFHRIAPLGHVALRGVDSTLAAALRVDRDRAITHHTRVLAVLAEFETALDGIPWLAFKGPVLSEAAHPVPGLRSYKDLDILIDAADLRQTYARLRTLDWNVVDSNETLRRPELPGEIRIASPRRILTDLHWSMVVNVSRRQRFPVSTRQLLERRVRRGIGPTRMWALTIEDAVVHVCLHAALSGATRLIHLIDADQLARQVQDWDLVVHRAQEWGAAAPMALVIGRARLLLKTPVPPDLNARLKVPASLTRLMSAVDRMWPTEELTQDESVPRLVARALRPRTPDTIASIMRSGALAVVHRRRPSASPVPRMPADEQSIQRYVTAVEQASQLPSARA